MSDSMQAMVLEGVRAPLKLRNMPMPVPGPGEFESPCLPAGYAALTCTSWMANLPIPNLHSYPAMRLWGPSSHVAQA